MIYARVSSKEQEKEGFSIHAQLKLLKDYATANGFTVTQEGRRCRLRDYGDLKFERGLMIERQKVGVAAAKAAGRYKGRAPTVRRKGDEIVKLALSGMPRTEIAKQLGVSRGGVHRILKELGVRAVLTAELGATEPAAPTVKARPRPQAA